MIAIMSTPSKDWDARKGGMVRKRRQALDWEQRELAERVGVHVNSVQRWESGKQYPGRHLGKLEAVLGIVFDDEPEPESEPAIPRRIYDEIMSTDGLDDERKRAVVEAVERTLRGRGEGDASARAAREPPERRRPAS